MPDTFNCPSCGAPLDVTDNMPSMRCPFCNTSVIVPQELRVRKEESASAPTAASPSDPANAIIEITRLIREGKKIEAIRLYRETFDTSLNVAKEAVEALEQGKPHSFRRMSEAFESQTVTVQRSAKRSNGCLLPLVAVTLLIVGVVTAFAAINSSNNINKIISDSVAGLESPTPISTPSFASVVMTFGSEGTGAGRFTDARSIALDNNGNIYVGEYQGGRVQVFDSSGKFITQWMVDEKTPLRGIAADRKGNVYVVQGGEITRYEGASGKPLGKVQYANKGLDDVAVTLDGGLVAASYTAGSDDVVRFDANGQTTRVITKAISGQSGRAELNTRVAADGQGNMYALGSFNNAVFKFSADGKFVNKFGSSGDKPGQFRAVYAIAVDGKGRVYVSDVQGIQVFESDGLYVGVIKLPKGVPFGLAFNDKDELFVAERSYVAKFKLNK